MNSVNNTSVGSAECKSGFESPGSGPRTLSASMQRPIIVIRSSRSGIQLNISELWEYRELLYFLMWRDVKIRYKQTVIGILWAVLQPLLTMLIFTMVFARLAKVPSNGVPYPLFVYTGLIVWTYFSQAVGRSGVSLVSDSNLITKVYFPRMIVPISAALGPLIDFGFAFLILLVLMAVFGMHPGWAVLTLPIFLILTVMAVLAVGFWLSALNVQYRDIGHTIPFLIQFWMFASPVAYPLNLVPEKWRGLYALNPMSGVIEGFRWALLGTQVPNLWMFILSSAVVLFLLFGGAVYFRKVEKTFADVV